jgi:hypothetical protein
VDFFAIPAIKDAKQIRDTIATINTLATMGVKPSRIRVVFNMLEHDETVEDDFYPLIAYHEEKKAFSLRPKAAIQYSELYQRLRQLGVTIDDLLADTTDWKAKLREVKDAEERERIVSMISARRLAASAKENLDQVFSVVTAAK